MLRFRIEPLNDFRSLNGVIRLNIRNGFINEKKVCWKCVKLNL